MPTPAQQFHLDRQIFNDDLYARMRNFWFAHVPEGATTANMDSLKQWFGVGMPEEEKARFDRQCSDQFEHALKSVAPDKYALPPFSDYDSEIAKSDELASPFVKEVRDAQAADGKKGAETLLSLILLLDQMPRNIYRDPAGLNLVYTHYDRIAFALLQSSFRLSPSPMEHSCYKLKPVFKNWYLLPLEHSEHLPSHERFENLTKQWRDESAAAGDQDAVEYIDKAIEAGELHIDPIKRFGRYPHRNGFVGRTNTPEEDEYMKTAKTFGVTVNGKKPSDR